jgi:hypothetical protein
MHSKTIRNAGVLAIAAILACAGVAFADTVPADGDAVIAGDQNLIALGVHQPGEVVTRDVAFRLLCGGSTHPAAGSVIDVTFSSATVPPDGAASGSATSIGPVPDSWPLAGDSCPTPAPSLAAVSPSHVTLTMPTTPGTGYRFTLLYVKAGASGSSIPVGTTTVTCTATDASGNHSSAAFDASVTFVSPVVWSAVWGEPVSSPGGTFVSNGGRTIPVKVELFADGVEQTTGEGSLSIVGCDGGTAMVMALSWDGGRWNGHLDAGSLGGPGCYQVTALLNGNAAGSFRLDVRGGDAPASTKGPKGAPARR